MSVSFRRDGRCPRCSPEGSRTAERGRGAASGEGNLCSPRSGTTAQIVSGALSLTPDGLAYTGSHKERGQSRRRKVPCPFPAISRPLPFPPARPRRQSAARAASREVRHPHGPTRNRKADSVSAANRAVPRRGLAQPFPFPSNDELEIEEAVRNAYQPILWEEDEPRLQTIDEDRPL
jgi:hypothetical protein